MEGPGWIERLRRTLAGGAWPFGGRRRPASPGAYLARRQRRRVLGLLGRGWRCSCVIGAGGFLYLRRGGRPALAANPSIVVLPFANLSGDASEDYFADGMTEEIQGALSQIPGLRVIGRTTSFALRGNGSGPGRAACPARRHRRPRGERAPLREPAAGGGPARRHAGRLPDLVPELRPARPATCSRSRTRSDGPSSRRSS